MPIEPVDKNLREEIIDGFHYPPGKDPCLGSFYGGVLQIVDKGGELANILSRVKQQRHDLTDKHLVNLLFRAVQAIELDQGNLGYRCFTEATQWKEEISRITDDNKLSRQLREILRTRSTNTTIYQRYAGPYAVISHIFDGSGITVADLGCGGNYGLRGIELQEGFQEIEDLTPENYIKTLVKQKINLVEGIAIDKQNPDSPGNKRWRLACSFYPQELDQLPSIKAFEDRIVRTQRVKFKNKDLLSCHGLPKDSLDVVILSTVLYQLQPDEQELLLEKARGMIKYDGILIVQDFAARDPEHHEKLDFSESWFKEPYSYKTYVTGKGTGGTFLEALAWYNARCRNVQPGEDFGVVFNHDRTFFSQSAFAVSKR